MPNRRQTLLAVGGIVTGTTALAFIPKTRATANLSIGSLDVPNSSHTTDDGEVYDVIIKVTGPWTIDANVIPDRITFSLQIGQNGGYAPIANTEITNVDKVDSGSYTVKGSILNSDTVTRSDLRIPDGSDRKQLSYDVRILMNVFRDGSVVTNSKVEDSTTIVLERGKKTISITAELGGSGDILFQENQESTPV